MLSKELLRIDNTSALKMSIAQLNINLIICGQPYSSIWKIEVISYMFETKIYKFYSCISSYKYSFIATLIYVYIYLYIYTIEKIPLFQIRVKFSVYKFIEVKGKVFF